MRKFIGIDLHSNNSVVVIADATWQKAIQARRPANVAAVALASKIARTAWAVLARGQEYQRNYVSVKPA
jgi:hypothetical protein